MHVLPSLLSALWIAAGPYHQPGRSAPPRAAGIVTGTLRYKGCGVAPPGATVSVIGRDASALADPSGRFFLSLPPGTYSLVFGGAGLVADQRVDDVAVAAGQPRDLGIVEVWPEERPAGCVPGTSPPPPPAAVVATAPDTPSVDLPGGTASPTPVTPGQIWVRGDAGSGPGQFGLQGDPERSDQDALGPSSFAVGPHGSLWVLDVLNRRVQRFDARGHLVGSFPIGRQGEEPVLESDIAVSEDEHVYIFTAGEPPLLVERDASGRLLAGGSLPPSSRAVDLLFLTRQRPVFLMQNGQGVRPELGWGGVRAEGPYPGVPVADFYGHAERVDRWRAAVKLSTADGRVNRSVQLRSRVPIAGVRLVGVDRHGEIVLAIDRAEGLEEATPKGEVLLVSLDQWGHLSGVVSVPPGGRRFEFRQFALAHEATVVQMQSDKSEVRFVRWKLRPPPRDAVPGEGLVRGRVVDPGRPDARAIVSVPKLRRTVPVASDGTFEVRVPAGTWIVSVRRASGGGGAEVAPVDVKVAVAPGATVDVGTVTLVPRPPRQVVGPVGGTPVHPGLP